MLIDLSILKKKCFGHEDEIVWILLLCPRSTLVIDYSHNCQIKFFSVDIFYCSEYCFHILHCGKMFSVCCRNFIIGMCILLLIFLFPHPSLCPPYFASWIVTKDLLSPKYLLISLGATNKYSKNYLAKFRRESFLMIYICYKIVDLLFFIMSSIWYIQRFPAVLF